MEKNIYKKNWFSEKLVYYYKLGWTKIKRSCLSIARSALSYPSSAQTERDNESLFFVHATDVHRFITPYHVNKYSSAIRFEKICCYF